MIFYSLGICKGVRGEGEVQKKSFSLPRLSKFNTTSFACSSKIETALESDLNANTNFTIAGSEPAR